MTDASQPGARQFDPTGLALAAAKLSPAELFNSYASGRVRHFFARQIPTVLGSMAIWIVDGFYVGLAAMSAAVLGDFVDCAYLRGVKRRLEQGASLSHVLFVSTLTALFQALTISVAITLAWLGASGLISPLLPAAYLTGAVVNAGMVMPYHLPASIARLSVYGLLGSLFLFTGVLVDEKYREAYAMNAAGLLILAFLCASILIFTNRGFHRNRRNTLRLTEQSRLIAETNAELLLHKEENQLLSEAVRHANDSVIVFDDKGRVTWVNDSFTRMTGYEACEAVGQDPQKLFNAPETDPETIATIARSVAARVPFRCEVLNKTKSGERIWIETNQVPFQSRRNEHAPQMYIAIERDVTESKRQARELAVAKAAAEEGARAKSEFLATMSHEIRTPMNGVIGMADLLCEGDLNGDQKLYAETIRTSSQALLNILNDVLDLSKLDAGRMQLSPVSFDLRACLDGVVMLLMPQAKDKGLWLRSEISDDLPQYVIGDDGRIRQILVNLIGNAVKFTETGGVTVSATAHRMADGWQVTLAVEDSGIGIPPNKLATIFERFSQADATTNRRFGGTGLGLTISRMLVKEMRGHVSVSSEVGQGSCFSVNLPLAEGEPSTVFGRGTASGGMQELAGLDILVAEDNRVNRLLIEKLLSPAPIRLRFVVDGVEAVAACVEDPPDLILMDMSMPQKSGLEATQDIRRLDGPQPVIVALTANAFASDRVACLEAGMDGFLTKPVRRSELIDCLLTYAPQVAAAAQA